MRREGLSLYDAARRARTTARSVLEHAGGGLRREGRRWAARTTDDLIRPMAVLTAEGAIWVDVRGSRASTLIGRHGAAVRAYRDLGDDRPLRRLRGRALLIDGRRIELLTDLDVIDRLAEGGELHYELYRR
jgi:hypothetical protein